jgi:hypothetical protein
MGAVSTSVRPSSGECRHKGARKCRERTSRVNPPFDRFSPRILFPPIRDDQDEPNSQADKIIPKLYVLGVWAKPWVLEGFETHAKAQYAINFQGGKPSDWAIAGRAGPDTFVMEEGRAFTVQRGPHSRKAFEAFKNEWLSRVASEAPKK